MKRNSEALVRFPGILGVPVEIHKSLLLFLGILVVVLGYVAGDLTFGIALAIILLISVYLHELGHAGAALWQGVSVSHIVLHGGGGLCYHKSAQPRQTMVILICGPLVNLLIWLVAPTIADLVLEMGMPDRQIGNLSAPGRSSTSEIAFFITLLGDVNMWFFLFNMIPVIPLDGGRLLFLALWFKLPRDRAVKVSGLIGAIIAVLWWPAMILLFLKLGLILFFAPSIQENWQRFKTGQG